MSTLPAGTVVTLPAPTVSWLVGTSDPAAFAHGHAELGARQARLLEARTPPAHHSQYVVDRRVRVRAR